MDILLQFFIYQEIVFSIINNSLRENASSMRHIRQIQCKQKSVLGFTVYAKKELQTAIPLQERQTGFEPATPTLARSYSTN